jgi:hypothetical protein
MLDDRRSLFDMAACRDVIDPKADEIAAAQLAVDCKVEKREIALAVLNLKSDPNGQTSFGRRGRFWPTKRPLFQAAREPTLSVLIADMVVSTPDHSHRSAHIQRAGHLTAIAPTGGDVPAEQSVSDRKRAEAESADSARSGRSRTVRLMGQIDRKADIPARCYGHGVSVKTIIDDASGVRKYGWMSGMSGIGYGASVSGSMKRYFARMTSTPRF